MADDFESAVRALKAGQPVVFPTDTVYGLGVAVRYAPSPQAIFDAKRRDAGKPVAWLVGGAEAVDEFGTDVPAEARSLVASHWPGALTVIVKASPEVPAAYISRAGTIGLRMPASADALALIDAVGPIATSSANMSGDADPRTFADVDGRLIAAAGAAVCSSQPGSGVASTVIDCSQGRMTVVRHGGVIVRTEDAGSDPTLRPTDGHTGGAAPSSLGNAAGEGGGTEADMLEDTFSIPIDFLSHDGKTRINAKLWTSSKFGDGSQKGPEQPRAVVQLVHGMAEYIDRYDDFANYLVSRGFVVCAEDHIGHGGSAPDESQFGHMPAHGGKDVLIGDVHTLRRMVSELYPDAPYVIYGHSMGSFIVRAYIARHGEGLAACVLSGTGNVPAGLSKFGRSLARILAAVRDETYRSSFIDNMGAGGYGKQIPDARTNLDWLSTDDAVVDAYIADEKCGFMFTVGGYATLLDLTAEVVTADCASRVPKGLPVLLVAGDGDPVGDMGKGVRAAAQLLRDAGVEVVDCKLYEGMRHEIHNEVGHEQVYDDIASWIDAHIG